MRRLTQKLAILEQELEQLRKASAPVRPGEPVRPPSAGNDPS